MALTGFIDHLVFRVRSLEATERFYCAVLAQPSEGGEGYLLYRVGETMLFFTEISQPQAQAFDKEAIGLNHFAFGVSTLPELESIGSRLDASAVKHSGIRVDPHGGKDYIWLDDPDGMRLEFYLRPGA